MMGGQTLSDFNGKERNLKKKKKEGEFIVHRRLKIPTPGPGLHANTR